MLGNCWACEFDFDFEKHVRLKYREILKGCQKNLDEHEDSGGQSWGLNVQSSPKIMKLNRKRLSTNAECMDVLVNPPQTPNLDFPDW